MLPPGGPNSRFHSVGAASFNFSGFKLMKRVHQTSTNVYKPSYVLLIATVGQQFQSTQPECYSFFSSSTMLFVWSDNIIESLLNLLALKAIHTVHTRMTTSHFPPQFFPLNNLVERIERDTQQGMRYTC